MRHWLPRILFWLGCLSSLGLLILTLLAPAFVSEQGAPAWLRMFAEDPVLRRTSILCAIGLFVTACVFFRATTPEE